MTIHTLRAQLDATQSAPYAITDNLDQPAKHIGDSDATAELIAAQNTIALLRERVDELVRKVNTNVQPTPGTRRLSTAPAAVADDEHIRQGCDGGCTGEPAGNHAQVWVSRLRRRRACDS